MRKIFLLIIVMILLTSCYPSNQVLYGKMIDMYSEDENYISLCGVIIAYSDNIATIECEELKSYLSYQGDSCDYYIYSSRKLDLNIGDTINFVTIPYHFYNGHKLPIVEVVVNGNTLLSFDEGKTNLINRVNTDFSK